MFCVCLYQRQYSDVCFIPAIQSFYGSVLVAGGRTPYIWDISSTTWRRGGLRQTAAEGAYGIAALAVCLSTLFHPGLVAGGRSFSMQLKMRRCFFESMLVVICGAWIRWNERQRRHCYQIISSWASFCWICPSRDLWMSVAQSVWFVN